MIPVAAAYIDPFFESLDELQSMHGGEVDKIINGTYDEIKETATDGAVDLKTGEKVRKYPFCGCQNRGSGKEYRRRFH